MNKPATCAFCDIATGNGPATVVAEWPDTIAILPRERDGKRGCTDGHVLVIPRVHRDNAASDPAITGMAAARAAELAARLYAETGVDFHLIINSGPDADMTIEHVHWHVVPRRKGDGLAMPWNATRKAA